MTTEPPGRPVGRGRLGRWVLGLLGAVVLVVVSEPFGPPWLRFLDRRVAGGDPRVLVLAAVVWAAPLVVPIVLAASLTRRLVRAGWAAWVLVLLPALPLAAFLPARQSGSEHAASVAEATLGSAAAGRPLSIVAMTALCAIVVLAGALLEDSTRARVIAVVGWLVGWGVVAGIVLATVDPTPSGDAARADLPRPGWATA